MNFSKKEIKKIAEEITNIGFVVGLSLREIKPEKIITTSDDGQHKKKYTKWGELLLPGNLDESCEFFYEEASESYMKRFPDFKFNLDYASKLSDTLIDPTKIDVGGVITNISGTKATNQRIYLVQNGVFRV